MILMFNGYFNNQMMLSIVDTCPAPPPPSQKNVIGVWICCKHLTNQFSDLEWRVLTRKVGRHLGQWTPNSPALLIQQIKYMNNKFKVAEALWPKKIP